MSQLEMRSSGALSKLRLRFQATGRVAAEVGYRSIRRHPINVLDCCFPTEWFISRGEHMKTHLRITGGSWPTTERLCSSWRPSIRPPTAEISTVRPISLAVTERGEVLGRMARSQPTKTETYLPALVTAALMHHKQTMASPLSGFRPALSITSIRLRRLVLIL